jgi:monovalent cation:H+ antiporter-2, CPA2 family
VVNVLFFVLLAALIGGLIARFFKIPSLVGYILAGVIGGIVFAFDPGTNQNIAELGVILLLFSVGLEISLEKLMKVGKIAIIGGIIQIILVSAISFWFMVVVGNFPPNASLVLSLAFSLSSTALIVKIMDEKQEAGTIHYEILTSWSLVQDLAVIPIVVLLPTLTLTDHSSWASIAGSSILTTVLVLGIVLLTGKLIAPYLTHLVAMTNSRELLILLAITLALGIASLVSLFGISAAFGAFLAGVVISKTQENHAIFSETRPLRDIFSILFFVSLGFLTSPLFIISHFFTIILLALFVIALKAFITFIICIIFGYRGKTAVAVSLGLAQVGEFAFVLFLLAEKINILPSDLAQIGIATTLVTLLISPFLFKGIVPIWRKLKDATADSALKKFFVNGILASHGPTEELNNHIVICGYGKMGRWIGKALKEIGVEYVIIDYNHKTIREAKEAGVKAVYGDASFPEILEEAQVKSAKAVIVTVPDPIAQEEIIIYCQRTYPGIKLMARAHLDSDIKKLVDLKIQKVVQPEFEAALAIVRNLLVTSGRDKDEVNKKIKSLRMSHSNI